MKRPVTACSGVQVVTGLPLHRWTAPRSLRSVGCDLGHTKIIGLRSARAGSPRRLRTPGLAQRGRRDRRRPAPRLGGPAAPRARRGDARVGVGGGDDRRPGIGRSPGRRRPATGCWSAVEAGRVVGFASTMPSPDEDGEPGEDGQIEEFVVDPPAQRRGHGSRLLHACADTLRSDGFSRARCWVGRRRRAAAGVPGRGRLGPRRRATRDRHRGRGPPLPPGPLAHRPDESHAP